MRILTGLLISTVTAAALAAPVTEPIVKYCSDCHEGQGEAAIPGWPPIKSYSADELIAILKGYRSRLNPESVMTQATHNMSDEDIAALAAYYGAAVAGGSATAQKNRNE